MKNDNLINTESIKLRLRLKLIVVFLLLLLFGTALQAQPCTTVAPTGVTSSNGSCSIYGTSLTTTGLASGEFQWGTGTTAGNNVLTQNYGNTYWVNPSITTTYWVRRYDATCGYSSPVFITIYKMSTGPTSISSNTSNPVISGCPAILTAQGAVLEANSEYQWGTGTVGSNIINGATQQSLNINPTSNTTYWVRIKNQGGCFSTASSYNVTVSAASTAPLSINNTTELCSRNGGVTLQANGGTSASGSLFQWGTGDVAGQNIIGTQYASNLWVDPSLTTIYWVRRYDPTCNTYTNAAYVKVYKGSNGPYYLNAPYSACPGETITLSLSSGTLGDGSIVQWGTGNTVGQNVLTQTGISIQVPFNNTTTYWARIIDQGNCGTSSSVSNTVNLNNGTTNLTGITQTGTISCTNNLVTLKAEGGTSTQSYQWGTGANGQNILSFTTQSIQVAVNTTTTYWVRAVSTGICNYSDYVRKEVVAYSSPVLAPTSITPTAWTCPGQRITLIANAPVTTGTYRWGTGNVPGQNMLPRNTNQIFVYPTEDTVYWVQKFISSTCGYTAAAFITLNKPVLAGSNLDFGDNIWNVYGFNYTDLALVEVEYRGYYTQDALEANSSNNTVNGWAPGQSPSNSAGWTGCPMDSNKFTFVYKRQGFPCGTYTLANVNSQGYFHIYVDGVLVYTCDDSGCSTTLGNYNLNATSTVEIRAVKVSGSSRLNISFTKVDIVPTAITGVTSSISNFCNNNTNVTLTPTGGSLGTTGIYQYGTGNIPGQNIIGTFSTSSVSRILNATTTFWVRIINPVCGTVTNASTVTIQRNPSPLVGAITSAARQICKGSLLTNSISTSGFQNGTLTWQISNTNSFSSSATVRSIANNSTVLTPSEIGPINQDIYIRAKVDGICEYSTSNMIVITVGNEVTYSATGYSSALTDKSSLIVNSSLTLTGDLQVCDCTVNNNATLTVNSGKTLTVENYINSVNGSIIVENTGSIVQINDAAINTGNVSVIRNTAKMKNFDFTYWSSPVSNFSLYNLSPNTLADKYFSFNPQINNWATILNGAENMVPGKGYIVRAPQGWSATNSTSGVYTGNFVGKLNNGVVSVPVAKTTATTSNLVGNPYASAVDADLFILNANNSGIISGTIYFWTHNTPISNATGVHAYNVNDYNKYNLTGGVKTASTAISGGDAPTGKIASGQSFFVETKGAISNGSYSLQFNNSMRVKGENAQFFRQAQNEDSDEMEIQKNRIWLTISNQLGAYDEALVGYITGATNEMEDLFDGMIYPAGNPVGIYSLVANEQLAIQGRALPFDEFDVVPVGFRANQAGNYTITLDRFDGLFSMQDVYLKDLQTGNVHDLKDSPYDFATVSGTVNNRFEVLYRHPNLSTNNPDADSQVYVVKNNQHIEVSSGNAIIDNIEVFDVTGKQLYNKKQINSNLFQTNNLNLANQVIIVKVTMTTGASVTKKIIF